MSEKRIIYGLKCPIHSTYRYIGQSKAGLSRPQQHLVLSHNDKVNEWIDGLKLEGKNAIIDVLEDVPESTSIDYRERFWIHFFKTRGHDLLNAIEYPNFISTSSDRIPTTEIEAIGYSIKNERLNKGISQQELSKSAGISRSTLSLVENGESVNLSTLISLCKELGLSIALIDISGREPSQSRRERA
ncbi:MAG TPA: helix-turn-helix domain-containing protein [Candidatus Paceibacterota bacterium]|nr:helix-turn-helix domain-containing protein [Candidatus Paceibacterota bacterium]